MLDYFKQHLIPEVGSPTFYPLALLLFGVIPVSLNPKPEIIGTNPFFAGIRRSYLVKSLLGLAGIKWILEASGWANAQHTTGSLVTFLTIAAAYPLRKYAEKTPHQARPSKMFGLFWLILALGEWQRSKLNPGNNLYQLATQVMAGCGLMLAMMETFLLPREQATGEKLTELEKRRQLMSRRMTVFSKNMARGAFPKDSNVPPPTIQTLLTFDDPPTLEELKDVLEKSVLKYYRFKSIPVQDEATGEWVWAPDDDFNLDDHIVVRTVDKEDDLVSYVEDMFDGRELFNQEKPRWNFHLVKNTGKGKSGVVINVSHILGDGLSFVRLALDMFTDKNGAPISFESKKKPTGPGRNKRDKSLLHSIASTAYLGYQVVASHARVAAEQLGPGDSVSTIKDDYKKYSFNKERETVLIPPISLACIKEIKTKLGNGATINDVLSGALAGAFRRYLEHVNDPLMQDPSKIRMRGLLPFSFPRNFSKGEKEPDLHNNWCFITLPLPVNVDNAVDRVREVNQEMNKIKSSADPLAAKNITMFAQTVLPTAANAQASLETMAKHSCVWTNVPGFESTAYLAGHAIAGIYPIISNVIPQVSALSYAGNINVNFVVDPEKFKEAQLLKDYFLADLEEVRKASGVELPLLSE